MFEDSVWNPLMLHIPYLLELLFAFDFDLPWIASAYCSMIWFDTFDSRLNLMSRPWPLSMFYQCELNFTPMWCPQDLSFDEKLQIFFLYIHFILLFPLHVPKKKNGYHYYTRVITLYPLYISTVSSKLNYFPLSLCFFSYKYLPNPSSSLCISFSTVRLLHFLPRCISCIPIHHFFTETRVLSYLFNPSSRFLHFFLLSSTMANSSQPQTVASLSNIFDHVVLFKY